VRCELEALREVFQKDPKGSGLGALSDAGKRILEDRLNVAVVVETQGRWRYRHIGNNIELIDRTGSSNDQAFVAKAMNCPSYKWITPKDPCSLQQQNLYGALQVKEEREQLARYLRATRENRELPDAIKDFVLIQAGEAIARIPSEERNLIFSPEEARVFEPAVARVIDLERQRLDALAGARINDKLDVDILITKCLDRRDGSTEPTVPRHVKWVKTGTAGWDHAEAVYSTEVSTGIKLYLRCSDGTGKTPNQLLKDPRWNDLVKSGKISAYQCPTESILVKRIDQRVILSDD
jgi:hypothetical protein